MPESRAMLVCLASFDAGNAAPRAEWRRTTAAPSSAVTASRSGSTAGASARGHNRARRGCALSSSLLDPLFCKPDSDYDGHNTDDRARNSCPSRDLSPSQRAVAQWQAELELRQSQQAQAQAAAIAANDDAQCQSYGAAPGSQSYIQYRMNLDNQRAQMRQMIAGQLSAGC